MLKPFHFFLFVSLLVDGGTVDSQPYPSKADAGTLTPHTSIGRTDGGVDPPPLQTRDGGRAATSPEVAEGIHWPIEVRPLATLDGPAVLAAHAALQQVLARFPKEYTGTCSYSAKALEVIVGQEGELYFVRINRRVDKCGRMAPGVNAAFDWFELYAVSSDGRVLARYPYHP
jgi:hypothetical protein